MTTVDIEGLLAQDELRTLLDACEHTGSIRAPEVHDIVEMHELTGLEQEALVRELDKRGIEIVEAPTEPAVWTRMSGFRCAPTAPARNCSGCITPSS